MSAFPTEARLKQMIQFQFSENLGALVEEGNLKDMVFNLIEGFKAEDKILELVEGAREENPNNVALKDIEKKLKEFFQDAEEESDSNNVLIETLKNQDVKPQNQDTIKPILQKQSTQGKKLKPILLLIGSFIGIIVIGMILWFVVKPLFNNPGSSASENGDLVVPPSPSDNNNSSDSDSDQGVFGGSLPEGLPPTLSVGDGNDDWESVKHDFKGTTMVLVPAGSFEMGSSEAEIDFALELCGSNCKREWFEKEAPTSIQHFDKPFWIDKTEVTRGAYEKCVEAKECDPKSNNNSSNSPNQPINDVSYYQAATYCNWRGARLPTEAEWEYAARGPDSWKYPWGNEFDGSKLHHSQNSGNKTANVGSYPNVTSWVGALDMSGNVWEWTSSLYKDYPYVSNDGRNLIENKTDIGEAVVLRGGSFKLSSDNARSAYRNRHNASFENDDYGFRCALP